MRHGDDPHRNLDVLDSDPGLAFVHADQETYFALERMICFECAECAGCRGACLEGTNDGHHLCSCEN